MKIDWPEVRKSAKVYTWALVAVGFGLLIDVLGTFELFKWLFGFDEPRWLKPIVLTITCGLAPFLVFHPVRKARDRAKMEFPWSSDEIKRAIWFLIHSQRRRRDMLDGPFRMVVDPFELDKHGVTLIEYAIDWAEETYEGCCLILGPIAGGRVWRGADFIVEKYRNAAAKHERLIQDVNEAYGVLDRFQTELEVERRRVEGLERDQRAAVINSRPADLR